MYITYKPLSRQFWETAAIFTIVIISIANFTKDGILKGVKTVNANKIRYGHIRQFSKLNPLEQLKQVLSMGHFLRSLMSKEAKKWAEERVRNGAKKIKSNSRKSNNLS